MVEASPDLQIFAASPFAAIAVDPELRVVEWNDAAARLFAIDRAGALGRPIAELAPIDGDGWPGLLAADGAAPQRRSAGARLLEWVHQPLPGGGRLVFPRDVTEQVEQAARDRHQGALLKVVLEQMNVILWSIDREGTFTFQRGKGLDAAGLQQDQFRGQNLFDIYADATGLEEVRRALAGESQYSATDTHGVSWENWHVPLRDEHGDVVGVAGITLNTTEQKRNELDLRQKLDLIERQQQTIRELATPVIEVWDRVITMPMIGLVDSVRTADIMDNLLQAVTRTRARFAILDLTGVDVLDTATASHLVGLIRAVRLLGADGIISGIQPNVAQTIVGLGLDLSSFLVHANLRSALKYCFTRLAVTRG